MGDTGTIYGEGGGGGRGLISGSILGAEVTFSYYLFIILKILGRGKSQPPAPQYLGW